MELSPGINVCSHKLCKLAHAKTLCLNVVSVQALVAHIIGLRTRGGGISRYWLDAEAICQNLPSPIVRSSRHWSGVDCICHWSDAHAVVIGRT